MKLKNLNRAVSLKQELANVVRANEQALKLKAKIIKGEASINLNQYSDDSGITIPTQYIDGNYNVTFYTAIIVSVINALEASKVALLTELGTL